MADILYDTLVVCPTCGEETPNYPDCILCGHSLQDPDAAPRVVDEDEIQQMMMSAKLEEIRAKRQIVFGDSWDHAPWLERLQLLARIAPQHAKVHYYIGAAYTEMGQHRKAIVSYTRALAADPTLVDALRRRGDSQYILVPLMSDDVQDYYDRALADYGSALDLEPDVYTLNVHGSVIASLGELPDAIQEYDLATHLDPDYPETYFNRGYTYKLLGETDRSVADFQTFLSFKTHWNEDMVAQAQGHIKEMTEPD